MIIYNITTHVRWEIHEQWKRWLLEQLIPDMLATGLFSHHQLVRLLEAEDEEGPTYALQLYLDGDCSIEDYRKKHLENFKNEEKKMWGGNIYSFTSLMEVIN
jgi:hypothetical protein